MVTRRRSGSPVVSLVALLSMAGLVAGAFHDGITGTSLRIHQVQGSSNSNKLRWSREEHEHSFSRDLQSYTGSSSAKESCEIALEKEEADIAPGGGSSKCTCEQVKLDERYAEFIDIATQPVVFELKCVDERCTYCSPDETTCDRFSYGAMFEEVQVFEGVTIENRVAQIAYFETNQYIVGRPEGVVYTEFSDPTNPGSHGCSMEIDGLTCAVCEYINCAEQNSGTNNGNDMDVFFGLNVVCSNILISDGAGGFVAANDFQTCNPDEIEMVSQSQGVFEMYDPDYGQCFSSVEGCERDKRALQQDGWYECECLDSDLETDGVSPFLENVQLQCESNGNSESENSKKEICKNLQSDSIERSYSSYVTETNQRTIVENDVTVVIEETGCQTTAGGSETCSDCTASIDGTECTSCEMEECGEITSPRISCGNASDKIGNNEIIDLCDPKTAEGTPFEAFAECGFGEATKIEIPVPPTESPTKTTSQDLILEQAPSVSMMACSEKKSEFLQRTSDFVNSKAIKCECYLIDPAQGAADEGTLLECSTSAGVCGGSDDVTGSVCNTSDGDDDDGVCFREDVVQGFLADGSVTPMTRTTTYTKGNDAFENSLVGRTLVLTEYGELGSFCQLSVDGDECSSCELKDCGSNGIRPLVDCSNIGDTPEYNLTTCESFSSYDKGSLLRLTAGVGETNESDFSTCKKNIQGSDGDGENNSPIDPTLPLTCSRAQPLVLPVPEENTLAISSSSTKDVTGMNDVMNPNSNFGIVSFVSSTNGLVDTDYESAESCAGEVDGDDSPGLWYSLVGSGKGIFASVCREATNFGARISIYEGGCGSENLECVAGTIPISKLESDNKNGNNGASACAVHFIAEEGRTYHLRVHGGSATETGTFNLFLQNLPDEITNTCYSEQTSAFSDTCLECQSAKNVRMQQFAIDNDPTAIDCRCLLNNGTGGYHLTCVDMSCLKCNGRQNVCGFGTTEMEIVHDGAPREYESFYFMHESGDSQASEIAAIQTSECLDIQDPYQTCMATKEETMASGDSEVFCECRGISEEGDYLLICSVYDTYEYCVESSGSNNNDGFCADVLFGQSISKYGAVTSDFRSYTVNLGSEDEKQEEEEATVVTVERFGESCYVSINENVCASCEIVDICVNTGSGEDPLDIAPSALGISSSLPDFTDLSVDCSNILQEGQEIDGASATFECGSSGGNANRNNLLSILDGSVSPTEEALADLKDGTAKLVPETPQTIPPDAFPPTMAPVTRPTNPPNIDEEAETDGNATTTDLLDDFEGPSTNTTESSNTTTPSETDSTEESTMDSSASGFSGNRGAAWVASSLATLVSVALLLA